MAEVINGILIREVETKNIMTKSSLPVGGYSVNPYVGCTHACKYCYASFMKRFTGHKEEWGTFLDVKHWPEIKNPKKYAGQRVVIGSVTDGYNPQEEQFRNTRKLLEQLIGSDADILICTKSDLVVRDIDLLKKLGRVTVSWSINTLDENFKNDMDSASSIERRIAAMKQVYEAGIRTVCFVSPIFPGITNFEAIFERVKWYKIRIFSGYIIHNCLFETASKIEIFEPEQIALILYLLKDCFKICDTGEYRGYETDCTDTCFIYLLHSRDTALNARSRVHIVLEIFI